MKKLLSCSLLFFSLFSTIFSAAETKMSASGVPAVKSTSPGYNAVKWYRASAERNAIYHEVFSLAAEVITREVITQKLKPQQWGVIIDIDETTLDNSEWNYQHDVKGKTGEWNDFAARAVSKSLPGVIQFINTIHQLGGYITFVSNRAGYLKTATEKNLQKAGIYFDQILLDTSGKGTSFVDKNPRFESVIAGRAPSKLPSQKVIAWLGDNINDFPKQSQSQLLKQNSHDDAYKLFGVTYFVFPNPMYGSWEANPF